MTSKLLHVQKLQNCAALITALVLVVFVFPGITHAETTSVVNSVSVSASGDGAKAHVRTEINGEVIEDIEQNGSGSIESHTVVQGTSSSTTFATSSSSTIITNTNASTGDLLLLIEKLKALIQYYVQLLSSNS